MTTCVSTEELGHVYGSIVNADRSDWQEAEEYLGDLGGEVCQEYVDSKYPHKCVKCKCGLTDRHWKTIGHTCSDCFWNG